MVGESTGGIFPGVGMSKFSGSGGLPSIPLIPQVGKTLNLGVIFLHQKLISYFFQVCLFDLNTVLATYFKYLL